MKLLGTAYSALKNEVKCYFSCVIPRSDNSSYINGKQIHFLVPNLCVKPISVTDRNNCIDKAYSNSNLDEMTMRSGCLKIYLRESSIPVCSDSLCHETRPSPVKSLIASDRRRIKSTSSTSEYRSTNDAKTLNGFTTHNESRLTDVST